jgi:hypothetical protein
VAAINDKAFASLVHAINCNVVAIINTKYDAVTLRLYSLFHCQSLTAGQNIAYFPRNTVVSAIHHLYIAL